MVDSSSDVVSLRNFVVDDDRANLGSDLWKSLDKNAFILAQRDAIEAHNLARAIRLSEESAANEERIRLAQADHAARSLARSWNVDGLQSALLSHQSRTRDSATPSKRRKPSSAQSQSQTHYSYSTSNYSYHYPPSNNLHPTGTSHASVHAQQLLQAKKHSSSSSFSPSSRLIQAGHILNPKDSSPPAQSPSSFASAQAAAAEREKEKEKGKQRSRSNSSSNSSSRKVPSSSATHQVHTPPAQPQQTQNESQVQAQRQGPRDIFAPVRSNCTKCRNPISSLALSQPSLALTCPDPFSHPFSSTLHVICNNPSCGAVHCRGCLQAVKCRDVDYPSSLEPFAPAVSTSTSTSPSPPASNPTSPTRPAFPTLKSHQAQRACVGGPGCALWSCCSTVRVIAIWEALRAFDALFAAEAGFQVGSGSQAQAQERHRESYIRSVISKSDKSSPTRKFEDGFVRVLKVIASWLQLPPPHVVLLPPCEGATGVSSFGGGGGGGGSSSSAEVKSKRQSTTTILDSDQTQTQSPDTLLLHLARLLLSSHLLEVIYTFLSNRNVKDWMTHTETYLDVLDLVGRMMDCGLGFLLKEVVGSSFSLTTPASSGFYNPFTTVGVGVSTSNQTTSTSAASSSPSQSPPIVPITSSSTTTPTLYELISQLESYRGDLKKFLNKVSFGVTVDKASKLHEAITYLVLQLVVGEF